MPSRKKTLAWSWVPVALLCFSGVESLRAQAAAAPVSFSVLARFPFNATNSGIFLPVTVRGREYLGEPPAPAPVPTRVPSSPYTSILLPGGTEKVMLDSGSYDFGALAPAKFDELAGRNQMQVAATNWIISFGRRETVVAGRLEEFSFAGKEFCGAVFERSEPSRLGWTFLTNYNWLLDFPHDRIVAEPLWQTGQPPSPPRHP